MGKALSSEQAIVNLSLELLTMDEKDLRKRKVDLSFNTKVSKPGVSWTIILVIKFLIWKII